ncbi:MAG: hypothetical protein WBH40_04495 [Ignavibacteriaceae bacterium]
MKQNIIHKQKLAIIIMLFFAFAVLLALADRAPLHLEKHCPCVHLRADVTIYINGVTQLTSPGPHVYRIFLPYLVTGLHSIFSFLSLVDIDLFLKIFFLIICQLTFYYYLRNFFSILVSLTGVFILDILLSFTFSSIIGPSIGENADLLNFAIFVMALNALYKNSFGLVLVLLFIGTFNRETTWFLIPIIFLHDFFLKKNMYGSLLASLAVAIPYFGLRIIIRPSVPGWFTFEGIIRNIPFLSPETTANALRANVHTAVLLGPLIILSLLDFKKHPHFLRIASYITPLFVVLHYIFGTIIETRLWLPLFILLIPLALSTLILMFNIKSLPSSDYLQAH